MSSIILTTGWRGFGYSGDLIPEVRCGLVSIAWCRGTLMQEVQRQATEIKALRKAMELLGVRVGA